MEIIVHRNSSITSIFRSHLAACWPPYPCDIFHIIFFTGTCVHLLCTVSLFHDFSSLKLALGHCIFTFKLTSIMSILCCVDENWPIYRSLRWALTPKISSKSLNKKMNMFYLLPCCFFNNINFILPRLGLLYTVVTVTLWLLNIQCRVNESMIDHCNFNIPPPRLFILCCLRGCTFMTPNFHFDPQILISVCFGGHP